MFLFINKNTEFNKKKYSYRCILFFSRNQLATSSLNSFNELRDFRTMQSCKGREISLSGRTSSNLHNEKQIRPTRLRIVDEGRL